MAANLPDDVRKTIAKVGIYVPDGLTDGERVFYERALEKQCMLCECDGGEKSTIVVNELGVVLFFCSQVCLQDFVNMHWLMEKYDDMVDAARFRNQKGNN